MLYMWAAITDRHSVMGLLSLPCTFSFNTHIANSLVGCCSHTACLCRVQVGIIGQGAFGVVIQAVDESTYPPQEVAIKLLPRGDLIRQFRTYVTREILHQSVLKHPFVVGLKEVGSCVLCLSRSFICFDLSPCSSPLRHHSTHLRMFQHEHVLQVFLTQHHLAIAMEYVQGVLFGVELFLGDGQHMLAGNVLRE